MWIHLCLTMKFGSFTVVKFAGHVQIRGHDLVLYDVFVQCVK